MFGIYPAYKCLHANKCSVFTLLINVYMPTNVGMLTFISRINFMLSSVKLENGFITLGADQTALNITINSYITMFLKGSHPALYIGPHHTKDVKNVIIYL